MDLPLYSPNTPYIPYKPDNPDKLYLEDDSSLQTEDDTEVERKYSQDFTPHPEISHVFHNQVVEGQVKEKIPGNIPGNINRGKLMKAATDLGIAAQKYDKTMQIHQIGASQNAVGKIWSNNIPLPYKITKDLIEQLQKKPLELKTVRNLIASRYESIKLKLEGPELNNKFTEAVANLMAKIQEYESRGEHHCDENYAEQNTQNILEFTSCLDTLQLNCSNEELNQLLKETSNDCKSLLKSPIPASTSFRYEKNKLIEILENLRQSGLNVEKLEKVNKKLAEYNSSEEDYVTIPQFLISHHSNLESYVLVADILVHCKSDVIEKELLKLAKKTDKEITEFVVKDGLETVRELKAPVFLKTMNCDFTTIVPKAPVGMDHAVIGGKDFTGGIASSFIEGSSIDESELGSTFRALHVSKQKLAEAQFKKGNKVDEQDLKEREDIVEKINEIKSIEIKIKSTEKEIEKYESELISERKPITFREKQIQKCERKLADEESLSDKEKKSLNSTIKDLKFQITDINRNIRMRVVEIDNNLEELKNSFGELNNRLYDLKGEVDDFLDRENVYKDIKPLEDIGLDQWEQARTAAKESFRETYLNGSQKYDEEIKGYEEEIANANQRLACVSSDLAELGLIDLLMCSYDSHIQQNRVHIDNEGNTRVLNIDFARYLAPEDAFIRENQTFPTLRSYICGCDDVQFSPEQIEMIKGFDVENLERENHVENRADVEKCSQQIHRFKIILEILKDPDNLKTGTIKKWCGKLFNSPIPINNPDIQDYKKVLLDFFYTQLAKETNIEPMNLDNKEDVLRFRKVLEQKVSSLSNNLRSQAFEKIHPKAYENLKSRVGKLKEYVGNNDPTNLKGATYAMYPDFVPFFKVIERLSPNPVESFSVGRLNGTLVQIPLEHWITQAQETNLATPEELEDMKNALERIKKGACKDGELNTTMELG